VPVWGEPYTGAYLEDALDSIAAQDGVGPIVVVDNCAGEPLPARQDVEIVRSPRRLTLGAARNLGLAAVRTPAVMFWDADDVMLPGTLRRLEQALGRDPAAVAVAAAILERPGVEHHWPRPASRALAARSPRAFALAHAVLSQFPTTGCVLLRTDAVRDAGGFPDAGAGSDWVLGAALGFRGRVAFDPRPGRLYRQHGASISASRGMRDRLASARDVRARLRSDARVPAAVRHAGLLIGAAQLIAIAAGPLARLVRIRTSPLRALRDEA
jgi:glycosyltransferase involved in cell wall biosynthesis